jgi:hypothetical protein
MDEPSTWIVLLLEGLEPTVICTVLVGAKVAISVIGPFVVTEAEGEVPLNDPEPEPVHETKAKPLLGVASIGITALAFWYPVGGATVPPALDCIVRRYCCWYVAVYVTGESGTVIV